MPIRPENMAKYPGGSIRSPEWLAIREHIGARSGWCCEACKAPHGQLVCRGKIAGRAVYMVENGDTFDEDTGERLGCFHLYDLAQPRWVKIVLTVAHVDGDETNSADENLKHWCQLHHNRHDAKSRAANAAITRAEKAGQMDLLGRKRA